MRGFSADRDRRTRENVSSLREPELPRVVRVLRGQRVRGAPRPRVQRDPQRGGDDRHLAAVQVPPLGQGRHAPRGSDRDPGSQEGLGRLGHLHAVVRRARQGHRRRHGLAPRGERLPLDGGGPEPALVPPERRGPRRQDRGHLGRRGRARAAGADLGPPAQGDRRGRHREPQVLQGHLRQDRRHPRRHLAHRVHGRPRLRDLDPVEGRREGVGRADDEGQGLRHPRRGHARARRVADRGGPALDRRGLQRLEEGADRCAEVHAARDGARPPRRPRQGPLRRPGSPAQARRRKARRARSWASSSTGTRSRRSTRS